MDAPLPGTPLPGAGLPGAGLPGARPDDGRLVSLLRADLDSARYRVDVLRAAWGDVADAALARGDRVPAARALAARDDRASILARWLLLGMPVTADDVRRALPSLGVEGAVALGLAVERDGALHPGFDLRPYDVVDARGAASWWVASDLGELATGGPLPTDHVLGIGGASTTLAGLQLPGRAERALDLGTGSGIQSLHLSRESSHVVATDISPRALAFAALTAALNGVRLELRLGSMFDPVAGERFDRIVSNPPFVITPRRPDVPAYEYRDGGEVGDRVLEQLIARLPEHLAPGGVAQLLGNWEYRGDGDGLRRAAAWAEDAGLEYWIVERERQDVAEYAETWIRDGGTRPGGAEFEGLVDAWLEDFSARDVTAVGFGYLLLRAPGPRRQATLRRTERLTAPLGDAVALGEHLARALAAHDRLASLDDMGMRRLRLAVAPDVTEERHHWPGEEHPAVILLRQGGGFRREVRAGTALAAVVGACDGELELGAILDAVADLLDVSRTELTREVLPEIRELLVGGLLSEVHGPPRSGIRTGVS